MNLYEIVVESLQSCKGNWRKLSEVSGVDYSTLCKIASGVAKDPRFSNLDGLYNGLKEMKLLKTKKAA